MKTGISRRAVLHGIGQSAALGSLAAVLPGRLRAAEGAATPSSSICLTMLYPSGDGLTFDADAYRDRHMAVLRKAYGEGVARIELRIPPPPAAPPPAAPPPGPAAAAGGVSPPTAQGEAGAPAPQGDGAAPVPPTAAAAPGAAAAPAAPAPAAAPSGPPPPLLAAVSMWISDFKKFADGANAHAKEVGESMATITRSAPMAQFDTVVAQFGAARSDVLSKTRCLTYLIEAKDGAKWDSNSYATNYLPRFFAAYGPEAIKRIEVAEGIQSANGEKALMLGSVNFYIADADKFVEATNSDAVKQVVPEESQYFSTAPIQTIMQVYAVG
jgi:hypothetical protein